MKFTSTLILAVMAAFFLSCSNSSNSTSNNRSSNDNIPVMNAPASNANSAAQGAQHYVCPNGCAGSGGASAGTCPVCGTAYIHNASFHAQSQSQPQLPPSDPNAISPIFTDKSKASSATADNAGAAATATTSGSLEHYTCPNGCVGGGSDSSGSCSVCGAALTHNTAYHSQSTTTSPVDLQAPATNTGTNPGVSHYICSNGCAGSGSNSSGNCSVCGQALTHNSAYHQ